MPVALSHLIHINLRVRDILFLRNENNFEDINSQSSKIYLETVFLLRSLFSNGISRN